MVALRHVERLQLVATQPILRRRAPDWLRLAVCSALILLLTLAALQLAG